MIDFEKNNERLEQIIKELENDNITLDNSMKLFEEAVNIVKESQKIISSCKEKMAELVEVNDIE